MGFTKLDQRIINSSLWSEGYHTRIVFVTMLAMADSEGFVGSSYSGLERAANVTKDELCKAVEILESPDEDSRSKEENGSRIKKADGGWVIVNYKKYREYSYSSNPEAERKRKYRKDKMGHVPKTSGHSVSVSASVSEELIKRIFDCWNTSKTIIHRTLTDKMKSHISQKLQEHTEDELIRSIDNYAFVIKNENSFYKYRSTIEEFFRPGKQKSAPCEKFMPGVYHESSFVKAVKVPSSYSGEEATVTTSQPQKPSLTVMQNRLYGIFRCGAECTRFPAPHNEEGWEKIYKRMAGSQDKTSTSLLICKELGCET